ncbi:uncharacterized protein [Rutidosis leptorrhynchoides]|uniref:uncharacterized protein n=1 Tax=Rutidosis leptorrhynchoides TaxID=125765 RepID=UPI003A9A13DE
MDNWLGDDALKDKFRRLFRLETDVNCTIADRFVNRSWSWVWNRSNIGATNEAAVHELGMRLNQVVLGDGTDSWIWSLSNDVGFSVCNTRVHIDDLVLPSATMYTMWVKQVPRKINIFIWRWALDRLPTRLNLSRSSLEIESIGCWHPNYGERCGFGPMFCYLGFSEWTNWIAWFEDWRESEDVKSRLYVIVASTVWHIWRSRGKKNVNWNDWRVKPLCVREIKVNTDNKIDPYQWLVAALVKK